MSATATPTSPAQPAPTVPTLGAGALGLADEAPLLPTAWRDRLLGHLRPGGARDAIEITTPMTEHVLGTAPSMTADDVAAAVDRARAAQPAWADLGVDERARILRRAHDLVFERQDEVLDLVQLEAGKVRAHAYEEVADTAMVAAHYARVAGRLLADQSRQGALPGLTRTAEVRHPKGVVGFITPWNYPLSMSITDAIPALLAGNACVIKPAQTTPFTALWAVDVLVEAGVPADVLQVVTGRGSVLGTPLIEAVDFVTFTGSTEVGRSVASQAGQRLIGCSLELGGKNASIVLDDVDLDEAVDGAIRGCFASAGQLCISIERLYVPRTMVEAFTERLVRAVEQLELVASLDWRGGMGCLQSRSQLETVERHLADARAKGATVLTGGQRRPDVGPLFFAPTVLVDVDESMAVATEETFGPVVTVYPYDDVDAAVAAANDSAYGLNASVWTGSTRRGAQVGRRIQAGTVNVNDSYAAAWGSTDAPMGGFKDSGLGRRHGREGLLKYTEVQTVAVQRGFAVGTVPLLGQRATASALTHSLRALHAVRARLPR